MTERREGDLGWRGEPRFLRDLELAGERLLPLLDRCGNQVL